MKKLFIILFLMIVLINVSGCEIRFNSDSKDKSDINDFSIDDVVNDKEDKDLKEERLTDTLGRIEVSSLNIKSDILSNQVLYSESGLNKLGNTVILVDNSFSQIKEDMEIYIRDNDSNKIIYSVSNVYEISSSDKSFYESDSPDVKLILVIDKGNDKSLVIEAIVK